MPAAKLADVESEYQKNKDLKKEDVLALQEWMDKQPHLPKISELKLILFLQSCYFSNEFAKKTIDNFYTMRTHSPELFANWDPTDPKNRDIFAFTTSMMPIKTKKENYKIFWGGFKDPNPERFNIPILFKMSDMSILLGLEQEGTSDGHILVMDVAGLTLSHLARINLLSLKKFLYYIQEALPVRLKAIHVINVVPIVDKLVAMVKPFMKKELYEVLYIHSKLEECFKFIPQECFPSDLGGKAPSRDEIFDLQKQRILDNVDFLLKEEKLKADESKRVGKPNNMDKIFGVEGTFKKLDID